ncbi:helix-turn-helix domain-containing protein [Lacimicrobium alkaliphilum]|uniref:HTH cro/C1-type domain-containing protein n=1 Tax=Lacimicrobium alkaliphilum TaxID=1526571 RepID=A0A0U3B081_9ALTE|nr:helix-turn-helix transcriptional regulator [Lacimicrobium alkaliphilum]ALS96889.1 hypothetical protein AT746_00420 [Lacimicrobium alkaliphilum]
MKVNVGLVLKMRKDRAWSQDELAIASGLNLRTIQRIEKEATASLQSIKALASTFDMNIRDLEYEDAEMINELLDKDVLIVMGLGAGKFNELSDDIKGKVVEIDSPWIKVLQKNKPLYLNINHIKRIVPQ